MKVRLSDAALRDLTEIGLYVAAENPKAARTLVLSIRAKTEEIGLYPAAFPVIPRYGAAGIRRKPIGSYLIFYTVSAEHVLVVRILHAARNYATLLDRPSKP